MNDESIKEVSIFDNKDERALINILPTHVSRAVRQLDPEDLMKTEDDQEAEMLHKAFPCRIRSAFWEEYARAQEAKKDMHMPNVYGQICSQEQFHNHILNNKKNLLWVITPPTEFMITQKEHLQLGTKAMRKIFIEALKAPVLDMETARVVLKAFEVTRNIVLGPLVQRIDSRSINITAKAKDVDLTRAEMEQQISAIREAEKIDV